MEWLLAGIFIVISYIQTDRLGDAQDQVQEAEDRALANYLELQKAKEANVTNANTIAVLEKSGAECSAQLKNALDSIHIYEESGRLNAAAIDKLRRELEQSASERDSDSCVIPDWVSIER